MIRTRRSFTLIELLIVLALSTLALGGLGYGIHRVVKEQIFWADGRRLLYQLQLAQNLMLILDTDTYLTLSQNDQTGITTQLYVDAPFDPYRSILEKPQSFHSILQMDWEGQRTTSLSLLFSPGSMSRGTLSLLQSSLGPTATIQLPGYPTPLTLIQNPTEKTLSNRHTTGTAFPNELRHTIEEWVYKGPLQFKSS